jgi:hypothetical protein
MAMEEEREILEEQAILQREVVQFNDDELMAARAESGIYISVQGLCKALGLDTTAQLNRMKRTRNLARGLRMIKLPTRRGVRDMACLRLSKVALWLASVETVRLTNPAAIEKIDRYQEELEPVALQVFMNTFAPQIAEPATPPVTITRADVQEVAGFLRDHLDMAFGHVDDQLAYITHLLETLVGQEGEQDRTIAKIDQRTQGLSPRHKYAIKRIVDAIVLTCNVTYVQVYGPLKHRFHVAKYSEIPDEQFDEVQSFLTELGRKLGNGDMPSQQSLF